MNMHQEGSRYASYQGQGPGDRPEEDDLGPCEECGDEGWILDDCFEDTCCCADPETQHGIIPCPMCNPEGKQ